MGKILLIVSLVLALGSAGLGFINRGKLIQTREELSTSRQETVATQTKLDGEVKKNGECEKKIEELTAQKQSLDSEVAKQKTEIAAKSTQLDEAKAKLTKVESDLALSETDKLSKAEKITQLEAQLAAASTATQSSGPSEEEKARLAELETLNTKLTDDNKTLEGKLAVLQKTIKERETKQNLTRVTGRVLAVNQAWNFVVLSLGNKSGIESNMEFVVKRGSTLVGKVRTTTVEPATSIADIIPASLARGLSIQPGDDIIYQVAQN